MKWMDSGQIIIFHHPRFPWNKGISLRKSPFGVRSCEVVIIWPGWMDGDGDFQALKLSFKFGFIIHIHPVGSYPLELQITRLFLFGCLVNTTISCIYINLEPKWGPLFCLEKALFWGVDPQKNRGHWGSRKIMNPSNWNNRLYMDGHQVQGNHYKLLGFGVPGFFLKFEQHEQNWDADSGSQR